MSLNINILSLGCSKNTVDSEFLAGHLINKGYNVSYGNSQKRNDVVIINTCGFIGDAKEESIDTILYVCALKEMHKVDKIIVCGCLAERYLEDLKDELPLVDKFFGVQEWERLLEYLDVDLKGSFQQDRHLATPKHYAYFKISEGCDSLCSYCAIPLIKGRHISRPIEELIPEARQLVANGVKELILVAQNTTYYGVDLYNERKIVPLLKELLKIEGLEWIRLQYTYPNHFPMELIDLMKEEKRICNYIDLPVQHINNSILSSMNRNITSDEIMNLISDIRTKIPDIALRTTLIVGYPGETEEAFEELKDFVRKARFDRLGCFMFSAEEGTPAYELEDDIPEELKQERMEEILEIQQEISLEKNQEKVGREYNVIIDRREQDFWIARTEYDSPDVDNEVLISDKFKVEQGKFYRIKIVDALEFDLIGELI
ncbi:MAG: 30S ribosomal protein S12 methylthiotransferase RimO [Bacteroidales bacterium]|nr:30S ribosomal protein S12 methylthiotransferase RimO [Bacteroidales bacterium]